MHILTDLNGVTTSKRDRWRRFSTTVRHSIMVRDKNLDENAKVHMKHKPYACDFGGVSMSVAKYKCNDCGAEFNEPETYRECVGEFWGVPAYEEFGRCPVCKSDDYEENNNG